MRRASYFDRAWPAVATGLLGFPYKHDPLPTDSGEALLAGRCCAVDRLDHYVGERKEVTLARIERPVRSPVDLDEGLGLVLERLAAMEAAAVVDGGAYAAAVAAFDEEGSPVAASLLAG